MDWEAAPSNPGDNIPGKLLYKTNISNIAN